MNSAFGSWGKFFCAAMIATAASVSFAAPTTEFISPHDPSSSLMGQAVLGINDINGDGFGEILVGAPFDEIDVVANHGRVYLYDGATQALIQEILPPPDVPNSYTYFGTSLAMIPDVNGDGEDDLAIGGERHQTVSPFRADGYVYIVDLTTYAIIRTLASPQVDETLFEGFFGTSIAGLPSVNGNTTGDLLIGAPSETRPFPYFPYGKAYVFDGGTGAMLYEVPDPLTDPNSGFGRSVVALEDVNGDTKADFAVGIPFGEVDFDRFGLVRICSGTNGSTIRILLTPNPPSNSAYHPFFGYAMASIPDVNFDGTDDLAVGAPDERYTVYGREYIYGRVYIFNPLNGALLQTIDHPYGLYRFSARFGKALAGVPDMDSDGRGEVLIGAPSGSLTSVSSTAIGNTDEAYLFNAATGRPLDLYYPPHPHNPSMFLPAEFGASLSAVPNVDEKPGILIGQVDADRAYYFGEKQYIKFPPVFLFDDVVPIVRGADRRLSTPVFNVFAPESVDADFVYTVTKFPTQGDFIRVAAPMTPGNDTFTHTQVTTRQMSYVHNDSASTSDSLSFTITDGYNDITTQTLQFKIYDFSEIPELIVTDATGVYQVWVKNGFRFKISGDSQGSGPAFRRITGAAWDWETADIIVMDSPVLPSDTIHRIMRVAWGSGERTVISRDGDGRGPEMTNGFGLFADPDNNFISAETGRIIRIRPDGTRQMITTPGLNTTYRTHDAVLDSRRDILFAYDVLFRVPYTYGSAQSYLVNSNFRYDLIHGIGVLPDGKILMSATDSTAENLILSVRSPSAVDLISGRDGSGSRGDGPDFVEAGPMRITRGGLVFVTDGAQNTLFGVDPTTGDRIAIASNPENLDVGELWPFDSPLEEKFFVTFETGPFLPNDAKAWAQYE